ncbi:hypothetical protein GGX14DRAFT_660279 [Mycena pura]|uniref:Uncharacterized protein n=1 Tax=Mycena pura TaxID=153505 RepID=A0AAD6Y5J1_9AGAR|nr:hypothetical protein GGX14DRAFT_660279 [Mycena pura]
MASTDLILRRSQVDRDGKSFLDRTFDPIIAHDPSSGVAFLHEHVYHTTFDRQTDDNGRMEYFTKPSKTAFSTNIVAEIGSAAEGTWMASYPQGTLQVSSLPYGDGNSGSHRMIIAARCPTGASEDIKRMWNDGLAAVDDVRAEDEKLEDAKGLRFKVTEAATRSDGDAELPADILTLRLQPTYQTPRESKYPKAAPSTPRRQRNVRSDQGRVSDADAEGDVDMESETLEVKSVPVSDRKVGDTYSPNLLPDHRGPYFAHKAAKLVQREYMDEDGHLISPDELYLKLTEGTLFTATITFETFIIKEKQNPARWLDKKIYHIYVSKLKILDRGIDTAWTPAIPSLPAVNTARPSTPVSATKRAHDSSVDDVFASISPSPAKKPRPASSGKSKRGGQ